MLTEAELRTAREQRELSDIECEKLKQQLADVTTRVAAAESALAQSERESHDRVEAALRQNVQVIG